MIDPHQTGAYISRLRKDKDWTQLELAEKLHVTHQAVSRWEKGDSFPDISVLPQIARLFGTSVDSLLSGESTHYSGRGATPGALVEELAQGRVREAARMVLEQPEEGIQAALDAVPMTRPSMANEFIASLSGYNFQPHHISALAPFVSKEVLHSLLESADFASVRGEMLQELAPFVGREYLDRMALQVGEGALSLDELSAIAPFLSREALETLVLRLPDSPMGMENIAALAPFLNRESLGRLIDRLADKAVLGEYLQELAPFLGQDLLRKVIINHNGTLSADDIVELAPFLDKETLTELIRRAARE
jgi:transcriptional regulator with XRE-family HTH domain